MPIDELRSYQQRESFHESIRDNDLFTKVVKWIQDNLNPDDVFDDNALEKWADENYEDPKLQEAIDRAEEAERIGADEKIHEYSYVNRGSKR